MVDESFSAAYLYKFSAKSESAKKSNDFVLSGFKIIPLSLFFLILTYMFNRFSVWATGIFVEFCALMRSIPYIVSSFFSRQFNLPITLRKFHVLEKEKDDIPSKDGSGYGWGRWKMSIPRTSIFHIYSYIWN